MLIFFKTGKTLERFIIFTAIFPAIAIPTARIMRARLARQSGLVAPHRFPLIKIYQIGFLLRHAAWPVTKIQRRSHTRHKATMIKIKIFESLFLNTRKSPEQPWQGKAIWEWCLSQRHTHPQRHNCVAEQQKQGVRLSSMRPFPATFAQKIEESE